MAAVTLEELAELGYRLRPGPTGETILIKPQPTPAVQERIKQNKAALLLELRVRAMAGWWRYGEGETEHAVALARADPDQWRSLVTADERWRAAHPDRRPNAPGGHG